MKKTISLYIHIPFCNGKCYYCNFFSINQSQSIVKKYFSSLKKEILNKKNILQNYQIQSIYIGGGTPSVVDSKNIVEIMNLIYKNFDVANNSENTIECNPNSVTQQKLIDYKMAKINRISFGVQSLCNKQLKTIGRKHNKKQAINAIKLAKKVGFTNISADILLGLPNQKFSNIKHSIKKFAKLNLTHISAYMLILEENTKMYKMVQNKTVKLPTDEKTVKIYEKMLIFLTKLGYTRYEVSNFAKLNCQSVHNLNYWQVGEYIGFGVAAHSFFNNLRFYNPNNFEEYYNIVKNNKIPEEYTEKITTQKQIEEIIMLGLRTTNGVNLQQLQNLGYNILKEKSKQIKMLQQKGIISVTNTNIYVNKNYFGVLNLIILQLV